MGDWYWIGVAAGVAVAVGVAVSALLGGRRVAVAAAASLVAAAFAGYALAELAGTAVAAVAGLVSAVASAPVVRGALARGGTRAATAALVVVGALALAAASFVPGLGYAIALAAPVLGVRLWRRGGERYAGLRILARD